MLQVGLAGLLERARWWLLLTGVLAALSCSNPEAPLGVTGTYHLVAYTWGEGDLALPFVQAALTPGDTEKWYGATLTLLPDSTWTNVWQHMYCPGGVCASMHLDTLHGTFGGFPHDSTGTQFLFWTPPNLYGPGGAIIQGRRLRLYSIWIFER